MEATPSPLKVSLLTFILFFLISLSSAAKCSRIERNVLLDIKNKFNPKDDAFGGWDPKTAPDCCSWFGIACNSKSQITSLTLNLDSSGPALRIPSAIGDLPYLQSLYVHGNLTGSIPTSIASLANLQTLELSSGLSGPIPASLGQLKKMTSLDLSLNSLSGPIPSSLRQLASLTALDLHNNKLSGPIPASLGQLVGLDLLDVGSNKLSGPIPASLSHLAKASRLDLRANRLSGPIPSSFGAFKNPEMNLLFGQNRLSGPLPKSLGQVNISLLDLSMNQLTGDASLLFGKDKTALETIYLNNNHFKFDFSNVELPISIRNLNIQHNQIYGSLPKNLGQFRFDFLRVNNNYLCGKIPTGRRLKHISPDNFAHNKCLCGVPLPPCK